MSDLTKRLRFEQAFQKHHRATLAAILVVAFSLAWQLRFIQDDAFISFTYARSLVEGSGLTWFGDRVEGYTNFLWVLWIALGMKVGAEPIIWSFIGGMASFAVCIWVVWEIGRRLFDSFTCVLLAAVLLIGNFSALSYATGGLETMLQTALLSLSFLLLLRMTSNDHASPKTIVILSLTMAAAILTRLDSAVVVLIIGLIALRNLFKRRLPTRHTWLCFFQQPSLLEDSSRGDWPTTTAYSRIPTMQRWAGVLRLSVTVFCISGGSFTGT